MKPIAGFYHFFDVTALVTIGGKSCNVWAHLSAEYETGRAADVTYAQVVGSKDLDLVCSVGFMWNDPAALEPKNKQILVGYPLSVGRRRWEQVAGQWRVDCPVSNLPPNDTEALGELAKEMIAAVLAPSFGYKVEEVVAVIKKSRLPYFNPYGP